MKIFEKIRINLQDGKSRQIRLFDIPIIQYDKIKNCKTKYYIPFLQKKTINTEKPVFYLKVNRDDDYVFLCLQHWIDTVNEMNADFYILCDKIKLEHKILERVSFYNSDIKFLKSCKNKELKDIVKNIATKYWINATYAHLTTFWHAKKNNIKSFWNIDADDTMFALEDVNIAKTFKNVENWADKNNIDAFSLDMWRSRTHKQHWSFGITYINNCNDWLTVFKNNTNLSWQEKYKKIDIAFNLDWFFTYLKDKNKFNIHSFYINKCYFIHWGDFITNVIGSNICYWENNKIKFPILLNLYEDTHLGITNIADDCIKFEIINHKTFKEFAYKHLANVKYFPNELRMLHNITDEYESI